MESFFGIGLPELVLILLIAGIVMGPERIGVAARWLGRTSAQLQAISRGFLHQLSAELDGIQDAEEIKGAVKDMQDLRRQLDELKQELTSVTGSAARESQRALRQTQEELARTIAPPTKHDGSAGSNGAADTPPSLEVMPNRLETPDDPD